MDERSGADTLGFRPPLLAERYVVQSRLGRGGTSAVYLVYDLSLRTWRAAKIMHPESASDPELRERFAREAVIMARLDHPNIVRVADVATDVRLPYLVMEFLEAGSAMDWLKRHGPMPPALAVRVTLDVCRGLGALHDLGGTHRDVKPHNLLFDRGGRCKITDFGVARLGGVGHDDTAIGERDSHVTEVGMVMGTADYMAPEQRIDASKADLRADVYGVGATLFTLVTGRSSADLSLATRRDACFAGLPDELVDVLVWACAYRPAERPADTRVLAEALHSAPLPTLPPGTPSLASSAMELAPKPPEFLTMEQAKGLTDLIAGGVVRSTYEPMNHTTGGSLRPRERVPKSHRAEAAWSTPMATRREEEVEPPRRRGPPTPPPVEVTVEPVLEPIEPDERESSSILQRPPPPPPGLRPRTLTPPPARRVRAPVAMAAMRATMVAGGVVVVGLALLAAVGSVMVAQGARDVSRAEREMLGTQERLWTILDHHQPVVGDLARLGADRHELEEALAAFQTATPSDKGRRADAYLELVNARWRDVKEEPGVAPATVGAMADITEGRDALEVAIDDWREVASSPSGRIAIALGIASGPPD